MIKISAIVLMTTAPPIALSATVGDLWIVRLTTAASTLITAAMANSTNAVDRRAVRVELRGLRRHAIHAPAPARSAKSTVIMSRPPAMGSP
jgi:hypothetical protein